jgi:hypothetical protein
MQGRIVILALILSLSAGATRAQVKTPKPDNIYCSGMVTNEAVPRDTLIVSGEESNYKTTFSEEDYVYINKGSSQGVKVGDEFQVIRPVTYEGGISWFGGQASLTHKMGTVWEDEGRLRVVVAQPDVAIAQVERSCGSMQRGDVLLPFAERPTPPLKSENNFDRFAPPSGNKKGMLVTGKGFQLEYGTNDIAYVNLGSGQGVKVGDYFRIYRYQDRGHETAYQTYRMGFDVYQYGKAPRSYNGQNVPREIEGEGIVLRVTPDASTVLITYSLHAIYSGDYAEIE